MSGVIPSFTTAEAPTRSNEHDNEDANSGWGLKNLADRIWNSESIAPADNINSAVRLQIASPFAGLFSNSEDTAAADNRKQQQQQQHSSRASTHNSVESHEVIDDSTQTDTEDSEQEQHLEKSSSEGDGSEFSSEDEWEDTDDDSELPSLADMLARCWHGTPPSLPTAQQQQQRRRLLKHNSSLSRSRQLSMTRKKADSSWTSSWVPKAFAKPSLLNRSSSWHAKPLKVKVAEQVLGEGLVAAIDLVQRDIFESGEPLPEATIKFFVRAGAGVATGWAHSNLNRVFVAFGAYVAVTCGAMHLAKKAVKWLAWKLPWGGNKALAPAVTFTADVLLPTQFFGPWMATYVICKVILQERRTLRAAAEQAGADQETIITAAVGAALEPDSNQQDSAANTDHLQQQQQEKAAEKQQQHKRCSSHRKQLPACSDTLQRSGSLAQRNSSGLRAGLRAKRKALPGRLRPHPVQVPVIGMSTQPSGDVWGIRDP